MMLGSLGPPEILLILIVVLLLFGAKRIPDVMRSFGEGLKEFKKATSHATEEIQKAVEESPDETTKPETK